MAEPFQVNPTGRPNSQPTPVQKPVQNSGPSFAETLKQVRQGGAAPSENLEGCYDLRFSNHAQKRLQSREISLTDEGLARLATAVDKAEQRGGKESLVLMDELAFIVNIRERLVVTAIDAGRRGEGVFTQIDSVVIADAKGSGEQSA